MKIKSTTNFTDQDALGKKVWITFRTTVGHKIELRNHSYDARISLSTYVHDRLLGLPPPKAAVPEINVLAYSKLEQIDKKLAELVEAIKVSGVLNADRLSLLSDIIGDLRNELRENRLLLIGAFEEQEVPR